MPHPAKVPIMLLDRQDRIILEALQQDATLAVAEIAERAHLSAPSCWRRIRMLRDYQLKVIVPTIKAYEHFLTSVLLDLPIVESVESNFVLREAKQTTALPLGLAGREE